MVNYCFIYGFCSQKTSYYFVFKENRICAMVTTLLLTLVSIFAAGKQVQEAAKYSEREERSLAGIPYMEDRAIRKAQDERGNSIPIVCELFV